jgi:hypothetical protein
MNSRFTPKLFCSVVPNALPMSWRSISWFVVESQQPLCGNGYVHVEGFLAWLRPAALLEIDDCPAFRGLQHKILAGRAKAVFFKSRPQTFKNLREEFARIFHMLRPRGRGLQVNGQSSVDWLATNPFVVATNSSSGIDACSVFSHARTFTLPADSSSSLERRTDGTFCSAKP